MARRPLRVPVSARDQKELHKLLSIGRRPGKVAKRDNEYKRCGTANVFSAMEPKASRHFSLELYPTVDRTLLQNGIEHMQTHKPELEQSIGYGVGL